MKAYATEVPIVGAEGQELSANKHKVKQLGQEKELGADKKKDKKQKRGKKEKKSKKPKR